MVGVLPAESRRRSDGRFTPFDRVESLATFLDHRVHFFHVIAVDKLGDVLVIRRQHLGATLDPLVDQKPGDFILLQSVVRNISAVCKYHITDTEALRPFCPQLQGVKIVRETIPFHLP
jgi:hypothetical protein